MDENVKQHCKTACGYSTLATAVHLMYSVTILIIKNSKMQNKQKETQI